MKSVKQVVAVLVWCVVSAGCVAEDQGSSLQKSDVVQDAKPAIQKHSSDDLDKKNQFILVKENHHPMITTGACEGLLDILNTEPYENLYNDFLMKDLNGKNGFSSLGFKPVDQGKEKFENMIFKKFEMEHRPAYVSEKLNGYKDFVINKLGGFDYYIAHEVIFKIKNPCVNCEVYKDYMKKLPIVYMVSKKAIPYDSRKTIDFMILEEDMSGPNQYAYGNEGFDVHISQSESMQLLRYGDQLLKLKLWSDPDKIGPYLAVMDNPRMFCTFDVIKNK